MESPAGEVEGVAGGGRYHQGEHRRPLGLATPAFALFGWEVGDGLSTRPRSSATRWAGPARLSGNGFAGSAFDVTLSPVRLCCWASPSK